MVQVPMPAPVTVLPITVQTVGVRLVNVIGMPDRLPAVETTPVLPTVTTGASPNPMNCG